MDLSGVGILDEAGRVKRVVKPKGMEVDPEGTGQWRKKEGRKSGAKLNFASAAKAKPAGRVGDEVPRKGRKTKKKAVADLKKERRYSKLFNVKFTVAPPCTNVLGAVKSESKVGPLRRISLSHAPAFQG